jgi:flagellar biogenesis protein FliO
MSVVERLPIGPRRALLLVRLNDREILLSSTEQGVQAIETQDRQQRAPLRLSEPASLASNSGAAHNEIEEAS